MLPLTQNMNRLLETRGRLNRSAARTAVTDPPIDVSLRSTRWKPGSVDNAVAGSIRAGKVVQNL